MNLPGLPTLPALKADAPNPTPGGRGLDGAAAAPTDFAAQLARSAQGLVRAQPASAPPAIAAAAPAPPSVQTQAALRARTSPVPQRSEAVPPPRAERTAPEPADTAAPRPAEQPERPEGSDRRPAPAVKPTATATRPPAAQPDPTPSTDAAGPDAAEQAADDGAPADAASLASWLAGWVPPDTAQPGVTRPGPRGLDKAGPADRPAALASDRTVPADGDDPVRTASLAEAATVDSLREPGADQAAQDPAGTVAGTLVALTPTLLPPALARPAQALPVPPAPSLAAAGRPGEARSTTAGSPVSGAGQGALAGRPNGAAMAGLLDASVGDHGRGAAVATDPGRLPVRAEASVGTDTRGAIAAAAQAPDRARPDSPMTPNAAFSAALMAVTLSEQTGSRERSASSPAPSFDIAALAQAQGLGAAAPGGSASRSDGPVMTLPTPVNAPEFREALGVQVSLLAQDGIQQAELHLNPVEMGPMQVRIELDGQQAQVSFSVDNAQTRAIVEAGLPELASALREAGLTLTGGGVSEHARGQAGGGDGGTPRDPGRGQAPRERSADAEGTTGNGPARPRRVQVAGGVDLYA